MKNIRIMILVFTVMSQLILTAGASPVKAQTEKEPTGFDNVKLWIYPEYDQPNLLVMLEGQIAGVEAPAKIRFLVPTNAQMYSAGSKDAQGQYSGGPPDRQRSTVPGWDEISYEVKTDTFRVEYYDSSIVGLPDKSIEYEFRTIYPISNLQVTVQKPRTATGFSVSPEGKPFVDSEGFDAFSYNFPNLAVDAPLSFKITYTKSDSVPSLKPGSTQPASGTGSGADLGTLVTTLIIVAFAIGLVVAFFLTRKSQDKNRAWRRQQARTSTSQKSPVNQIKTRFCGKCGKPVGSSSKFCSFCGNKVSRGD